MTEDKVNFTPQHLKELRIKHRSTLDDGLVDWVKSKILQANLENKQWVELGFRIDSAFEKVMEYFENLGFVVTSSGYNERQYDSNGDEVYYFCFSWSIKENDW